MPRSESAGEQPPAERKPRRSKRGNGEGSIYLRKDGRWTAAYFVPKPGGGESRRYVYGRSPEEVETKLVEMRKQVQAGAPLAPAGLTVARYLEEWMEQVAAPRVRPNTARSYRDLIAKYLVPRLGRKRLGQLGARDVRQFLAALAGDGVGERTAQLAHAVLRAALEDAMREEIIPRNVAKLVRAPRPVKQEREPLTVQQVRTLLTSTRDHRLHALFVVFAVLGLRRSEVLGLRWDDVDLEVGVLRVRRSLHRVEGQLATFPTKTQRSARAVPLPGMVVRTLRDHQRGQEAERLALGAKWPSLGYVFTTPIGTPLDPSNCTRLVQSECAAAGLPAIRLHDLRHGCVSVLLALGVPPRTVMDIVGHSTLEMTMTVYGHVSLDDKRAALDQLGGLFDDGAGK
ncbi:site-specific recombinase XerD [Micromonospora palomenae]|uniref:Site-specific recombinase XerD n=1 Tax=Micromonospora palomenae TaxID=1461247 RepID=A0A561WFY1_9ACTN|nr:site-specific recombinase XerD [Micromonospora palomenae]